MPVNKFDANATRIAIDTGPLKTGHATRGIGIYTQNLTQKLVEMKGELPELKIDSFDFRAENWKLLPCRQAGKTEKYDLFHYPYFDLFYTTLPIKKPAKTVVTVHDVIPLIFPDHYPPGIKGKIRFEIQRFSLRSASAVITDSENSKKDIINYLGYPSKNIYVIYLAPGDYLKPEGNQNILDEARKKYHLPKRFVLYVGDINYNKNIPGLVKACAKIKIPLVIVGRQAVQKDIDRTHIENRDLVWLQDYHRKLITDNRRLILTGFVPQEELPAIYSLASVYCQPSFYEGFGIPVLEAMACGCPVASSNTSSLPEICGDAALIFDPNDYNGIGRALMKVLGDSILRKNLINKGYEQTKKFSWGRTARETIEIYRKVASSS